MKIFLEGMKIDDLNALFGCFFKFNAIPGQQDNSFFKQFLEV